MARQRVQEQVRGGGGRSLANRVLHPEANALEALTGVRLPVEGLDAERHSGPAGEGGGGAAICFPHPSPYATPLLTSFAMPGRSLPVMEKLPPVT